MNIIIKDETRREEKKVGIRTLQQDQPGHPGAHINRDWLVDHWRTRIAGRLAWTTHTYLADSLPSSHERKEARTRWRGNGRQAHNSIRISLSRPLSTSELARGWCTPPARASLPATLGFFKRQGRQVDKPVSMYAVISRARPSLSSSRNRETGFQLPQRMWYSRRRSRSGGAGELFKGIVVDLSNARAIPSFSREISRI